MGTKGSLGYSPLGEPRSDDSQFDFVADRKPPGGDSVTSIFEESDNSRGMWLANSFSEKVMKRAEESEELKLDHEIRPEKKVASYYLEKDTLKQLKLYADRREVSYSSVVEQAIQMHLKRKDDEF